MTTYNGSASITATANISAVGNLQFQCSSSITGLAVVTAVGNLSYKESSQITGLASITANAVYSFSSAINASATVIAKSLKAIWSGMKDVPLDAFNVNGKMYFLNGQDYFCYDGVHCTQIVPYVPTLAISKDPAGGGQPYEDFNLLGSGFKDSFSGDGVAEVFQLSLSNLDATFVTASWDGGVTFDKVEGTHFTVNHTTGIVTFITVPPKGTNNIIIQANKTVSGHPEQIKKCTFHVLFGGTNDTRVFLSGNPDFPNQIWRSGLYDPTYFPENGFYKIGSDKERVTGFSKQYDYLVIDKESSKGNMQYELDATGNPSFPIKPLNDEIGTIAPRSIQVVNNNPISLSKKGVYMIVQSNVRDERNIQLVSQNVDTRLLNETGLENAISIDYDRKYWLALNDKVYVYDYQIDEWYIYDNIPASCFLEVDGDLYFGGEGRLYRFKKDSELYPYNDDGEAINAYWTSKYLTFGSDERLKIIDKVFVSIKPSLRTSADIYYVTNKKVSELVKTKRMDQFDFSTFNFNFFSFIRSNFPQEAAIRLKVKKVTHFQLIIKNDKLDESMGILATGIKYLYGSAVK
jgi:hypothetical protein